MKALAAVASARRDGGGGARGDGVNSFMAIFFLTAPEGAFTENVEVLLLSTDTSSDASKSFSFSTNDNNADSTFTRFREEALCIRSRLRSTIRCLAPETFTQASGGYFVLVRSGLIMTKLKYNMHPFGKYMTC